MGAGGPLFDNVSVFAPFIIMMCLDGAYVIFALIAIKCGWIYDDVSKRKMNEYNIKETQKALQQDRDKESRQKANYEADDSVLLVPLAES